MVVNLSIRSKLIPLLAVPVAGWMLLGVAGIAGGFGDRARTAEEARVAAVAGQVVAAAHELQEERVRAVAWLAIGDHATQAEPPTGDRATQAELAARRRRVDRALAAYRAGAAGLGRTGDPRSTRPWRLPRPGWSASWWSGPRPIAACSPPSWPAAASTPSSTPSSASPGAWPPTWTPLDRPGPPASCWR